MRLLATFQLGAFALAEALALVEARAQPDKPAPSQSSIASSDPSSSPPTKPSKSTSILPKPSNIIANPSRHATIYDAVAAPEIDPLCAQEEYQGYALCHRPTCGLSPIGQPRSVPKNNTCGIALAGIVRIPDEVNGEDSFARIDYVASSASNTSCVPQLISYSTDKADGKPKWSFNACGTGIDIEGTPEKVFVRGDRGVLIGATGFIETKVEEARVQNCCLNFERFVDVPDWPFCGYMDYVFEVCLGEGEVKDKMKIV